MYLLYLRVAKELHARGVKVVTVLGFANKDAVILETELAQYGQVFVTTDDGSYGIKGNVSVVIKDLDNQFDAVYSCGAPGMMKYINQTFMTTQEPIYLWNLVWLVGWGPAMPAS